VSTVNPIAKWASSLMLIATSSSALAQAQPPGEQEVESAADPTQTSREVNFSVSGGAEHQFETGIDGGGEFAVDRFNAGLGVQTNLTEQLQLSLRFNYNLDLFNFDGPALGQSLGADPWDDIHTTGAAAIFSAELSDDFTAFGGPVVQFSREAGADWDDSWVAGGVFGATYRFSSELSIGGGGVLTTQIEDHARFSPILIINWKISDDFTLASQTTSNASGRTGIELIYNVGRGWELAAGAASQHSRFRLDSDGPVPDGVGQDQSLPIWLRLSCGVNSRLRIDAVGGVNTSGELNLEDSGGDRIAKEDYDMTPFVGVFGSFRF
jgi:hypothetical protein